MHKLIVICLTVPVLAACASNQSAVFCSASLGHDLTGAMQDVTDRLSKGCEYHFEGYFQDLLAIAEANPDRDNRMRFSDFLLRVNDMGVISRRQAKSLYNRYFGVKFVSLQGHYNTCAQTCPVLPRVLSDMRSELQDKELGLLRASADEQRFYQANNLLNESELVLEAVCRACEAGADR